MASIWVMIFLFLGIAHLMDADALSRIINTDKKKPDGAQTHKNREFPVTNRTTYFADGNFENVTEVVGHTAVLRCRVRNLGNRTVSWIRKKDLHILSSMRQIYTSDGRFAVVGSRELHEDWNLQISHVKMKDEGIYECQVNTEPKIFRAVQLKVLDIKAQILGPEEIYVKKGSTINLTCRADSQNHSPSNLTWYHAGTMIDFDNPRGGVSLEIEKSKDKTTSKLLITKASFSDGGNYTCVSTKTAPANVVVHVLNGENPAAMQHGKSTKASGTVAVLLLIIMILSSVR